MSVRGVQAILFVSVFMASGCCCIPEVPLANNDPSESHSELVVIKGEKSFPIDRNPVFNEHLRCPGSGPLEGVCIQEYSVSTECDGSIQDRLPAEPTDASAAVTALLVPLVQAIAKYFLSQADKTLSERLEGYSAVHGASSWHTSGPTVRCLRYTRYDGPDSSSPIAIDILYGVSSGDFTSSDDSDSPSQSYPIWIRPLRVFYRTPAPTNDSDDGKYAIASTLTLRAIGAQQQLPTFSTELLSRTYDESTQMAGARVEYYKASSPSSGGQYIPNIDHLVENGLAVNLSVRVAKIGAPPDFLKNFAEFISGSKGDKRIPLPLKSVGLFNALAMSNNDRHK